MLNNNERCVVAKYKRRIKFIKVFHFENIRNLAEQQMERKHLNTNMQTSAISSFNRRTNSLANKLFSFPIKRRIAAYF